MPLIEVGELAPDFALRDQHGKHHALRDYRGRPVVLYFYPEDDTSTCTEEACHFRDHVGEFRKIKAVVLGVSPDSEDSHAAFASRHDLGFTLLADPRVKGTPACAEAYGVWAPKLVFGKKVWGYHRTTYLIDPKGKVYRRWDRVRVPGHVARVIEALKALNAGEKPRDIEGNIKPLARGRPAKRGTRTGDRDPQYTPIRTRSRANRRTK